MLYKQLYGSELILFHLPKISRRWKEEKVNKLPLSSYFKPLPTIGNSLNKQKSLYKVLTPSIKLPI